MLVRSKYVCSFISLKKTFLHAVTVAEMFTLALEFNQEQAVLFSPAFFTYFIPNSFLVIPGHTPDQSTLDDGNGLLTQGYGQKVSHSTKELFEILGDNSCCDLLVILIIGFMQCVVRYKLCVV